MHWEWTTETWNGDDRPYRHIKATIDQAIKQGQSPEAVLQKYEITTGFNFYVTDPRVAYAWGYAAYVASAKSGTFSGGDVVDALAEPASPHSYEYDKLRFFIESYMSSGDFHLIVVGNRLLKREPGDYTIRYYIIRDMTDPSVWPDRSRTHVLADLHKAISLADALAREYPNRPSALSLRTQANNSLWRQTNDKAAGEAALAGYHQILATLPVNSPQRDSITQAIAIIEGGQVLDKYGHYVPRALLPH